MLETLSMKILLAAAALAAVPIAVAAQVMHNPEPFPVRAEPAGPASGITVRGTGTVTVDPTDATLTLYVNSRNNAAPIDSADLQPIVDAIVHSGVQRRDVTLPAISGNEVHANNVAITARVHHPTAQMVQNGIANLAAAVASSKTLWLGNAQVQLAVADCLPYIRQAQARAIEDAHKDAQFVAQTLGVHAGPVLALDAQNTMYERPDGTCYSTYSAGPYQTASMTPEELLHVPITASVVLRVGIR